MHRHLAEWACVIQSPQSKVLDISVTLVALHGWLRMLLRWGLPRFTAYNCLPLHRCRFSKYDSLILMCLGKHNPNTDAALHARANHCRCRLIISATCTPGWSVNSGTISSFARPPIGVALIDDGYMESLLPSPGPVLSLHASKKDNTCPILNGNLFSGPGGCLASER